MSQSSKPTNLSIQVPERSFTKIDHGNLLSLIGNPNVIVVDVRDEDYVGGHIKGSIHLPFSSFDDSVQPLVQQIVDEKKDTVVFTCMYSEQRGPSCACTFAEALDKVEDKELVKNIKIFVLSGGFNEWLKQFQGKDGDYIAEFDKSQWNVDPQNNYLHKLDSAFLDFVQSE